VTSFGVAPACRDHGRRDPGSRHRGPGGRPAEPGPGQRVVYPDLDRRPWRLYPGSPMNWPPAAIPTWPRRSTQRRRGGAAASYPWEKG